MPQVRHLRRDQRMQLRGAGTLVHSSTRFATQQNFMETLRPFLQSRHAHRFGPPREASTDFCRPTSRSMLDIIVARSLRMVTHIAEIVVKNLTISYASRKPRVTYGRFAGDFE
jgi:hypothetical protein